MAKAAAKISPFRLSSLLRGEMDPVRALQLFRHPSGPSPSPDSSRPFRYSARSYDLIVCKLGKARMFAEMEEILDRMSRETRFTPKEALFCRVISLYGRARLPAAAFRTFERIASFRCYRTVRSFNSLLHALLECGDVEGVRSLCRGLDAYGFAPDTCTYNVLIRATVLHGSLETAWELFDEMRNRGIAPTVPTFGTLVSSLCANSKLEEAFDLKDAMLRSFGVKPNVYIYTSLIKGLCKNCELDRALELKDEILVDKDLNLDSAMYSTLIRSLFRAGRKGEVVGILEEMKQIGVKPDTVTYNAIIAGFCEDEKDFEAAFEALIEMERKGCKPDVISYNTIIAGFCEVGRWSEASELAEDMPRRGCRPDEVSYRTVFDGMCDAGEFVEAGKVLEEMKFRGYNPTATSLRRFVEGLLLDGGHAGSAAPTSWQSLAKAGAMGVEEWNAAVDWVVEELARSKVTEVFDQLRSS